jgi:hypothetical protein
MRHVSSIICIASSRSRRKFLEYWNVQDLRNETGRVFEKGEATDIDDDKVSFMHWLMTGAQVGSYARLNRSKS